MAVLSAASRKKIPSKEFGLPGAKKYPMPDKSHAANAKARASEMKNKGKLSAGQEAEIDAKANKVLGKPKAKKADPDGRSSKDGTHTDGGVMYHDNMKPTHNMPVEHTSKVR